jgi:hypothetical protein
MGTAEENLYKEYQKRLKEKGIKQLTNEEIKKNIKEGRKEL